MSEQIVITKSGSYGFVRVSLPIKVKESMIKWSKKSGMSKAQFMRAALMIGAAKLAEDVMAKKQEESYYSEVETKKDCGMVGPA